MSDSSHILRRLSLALIMLLTLATVQAGAAWGSSVHHDQAIIISNALRNTRSIPDNIKENVDSDAIYNNSLAPDDWRDVTGEWGTYQYNMTDNAVLEFRRIRDAWARGDFDNAISRIGVALHYVGDVMFMPHNYGIRDYYRTYIPPLGSDGPLWSDYESGKYFDANRYFDSNHYSHHQVEAYTDSDSVWYPLKPENYSTLDNGTLDWYLDSYLRGPSSLVLNSDTSTSSYGTTYVLPVYIRQSNPYDGWSTDDRVDNRWFYWVNTRDPAIAKQDADNTIRITYNGVYRAIRDGEWMRQNGGPNVSTRPPSNWSYWLWPSENHYLSLNNDDLYKEGMDTVRWYSGVSNYGSTEGGQQGEASPQPQSDVLLVALSLVFAGALVAFIGWRRWRSAVF
ncbi:MAG: hypothetical protein AB1305_03325 [Candidatus Hadarchaeota archaeon]